MKITNNSQNLGVINECGLSIMPIKHIGIASSVVYVEQEQSSQTICEASYA